MTLLVQTDPIGPFHQPWLILMIMKSWINSKSHFLMHLEGLKGPNMTPNHLYMIQKWLVIIKDLQKTNFLSLKTKMKLTLELMEVMVEMGGSMHSSSTSSSYFRSHRMKPAKQWPISDKIKWD